MTPKELKEYRTKKGWTQQKLADAFGVHQSQVSRWESGVQGIPKMVDRLIECLQRQKKPD